MVIVAFQKESGNVKYETNKTMNLDDEDDNGTLEEKHNSEYWC